MGSRQPSLMSCRQVCRQASIRSTTDFAAAWAHALSTSPFLECKFGENGHYTKASPFYMHQLATRHARRSWAGRAHLRTKPWILFSAWNYKKAIERSQTTGPRTKAFAEILDEM